MHPGAEPSLRLQHRASLMRAVFVGYVAVICAGLLVMLVLALGHA